MNHKDVVSEGARGDLEDILQLDEVVDLHRFMVEDDEGARADDHQLLCKLEFIQ